MKTIPEATLRVRAKDIIDGLAESRKKLEDTIDRIFHRLEDQKSRADSYWEDRSQLLAFVAKRACEGDAEAQNLMREITGRDIPAIQVDVLSVP